MSEPHIAGHATHFLRRLDRAQGEQVELALALYNDAELLREVLARAAIPDGVERIAIALEHAPDGPHVVVTRAGKFVTCLGANMPVSKGTFAVSRERFEVAAAHLDRMRERLAQSRALEGKSGEAQKLWDRLCRAGAGLAREDFEGLARWEPILGRDFLVATAETDHKVMHAFEYLRTRRLEKLSHRDEEMLESWFHAFWAWAHVLVLLHLGESRERMRELESRTKSAVDGRWALTVMAMRHGIVGPSLRGLWAVGRHAREVLPAIKAMPKTPRFGDRVLRELPLAVIGHASAKSRAEVIAALGPATVPGADADDTEWRKKIRRVLLADLHEPEAGVRRAEWELKDTLFKTLEMHGREYPERFSCAEELPIELGLGLLSAQCVSWARSPGYAVTLAEAVPLLSRRPAEELFLPRVWGKSIEEPYTTEGAWQLVDQIAQMYALKRPEPARSTKAAGRNEPCPCGSGKKYKHCCA